MWMWNPQMRPMAAPRPGSPLTHTIGTVNANNANNANRWRENLEDPWKPHHVETAHDDRISHHPHGRGDCQS